MIAAMSRQPGPPLVGVLKPERDIEGLRAAVITISGHPTRLHPSLLATSNTAYMSILPTPRCR